ncbi:MAG: monooxygenase [Dehalococcoidia bacterium]|nr:MAG: monooxygenase [Dehalococcoidia bacterium]
MTSLTDNMTFGTFMAPFHRVGENPTLALERDLELIEWMDSLGFDEAWIGEHHSGGWETIASPEVFIATAAGRTRNIRLGTGVVSLPYHHPYMVANRMVLLDHLTRGRVMLGVGPGALASDANMFCIDPERQREMMDESLGAIMQLLDGSEPVTMETDWFKMKDATLQLRPYQKPAFPVAVASVQSPSGVLLAGKHGASVISLSVPRDSVRTTSLKDQWSIAEETAEKYGTEVRREDWRLSVGCHVAETREEAFEQIRVGAGQVVTEYTGGTNGNPIPDVPANEVVDYMVEHNQWIVGTPDDVTPGDRTTSGSQRRFWRPAPKGRRLGPRDKLHRSYELFARYVMPKYQGSLTGIIDSQQRSASMKDALQANRRAGLKRATDSYLAGNS